MNTSGLSGKTYDRASIVLIALVLALVLLTFEDYGITWDEPFQDEYGDFVIEYYRTRLDDVVDTRALNFRNLYLYGGAFDAVVSLVERISPLPRFETRHLFTAVFGLLGLAGCHRLTRLVSGPAAAFWATVLLAVTPRFYGHMFNNPKDIPFAVGYVWSLVFLVQASRQLPKVSTRTAAAAAAAIGVTMGIRVGGLILLLYWSAILIAYGCYLLCDSTRRKSLLGGSVALLGSFVKIAVPAYLIMLAAWPWAQQSPWTHPLRALQRIGKFRWNRPVLFDGVEWKARDLPSTYYAHYFGIVLPELLLVLLPLSIIVALILAAKHGDKIVSPTAGELVLIAVAALYPLIHVVVFRAVVYDGIRHMLFVLPLIAALAGSTMAWWIAAVGSRSRRLQTLMVFAVGMYLSFHISIMIRLHPYQTVYFNSFVGGLPGAAGRYETDYWGNSYREATLKLVRFLESKKNREPSRLFHAKTCSTQPSYYFPDFVRSTGSDWRADFYIATTRWRCDEKLGGRIIATVERYGVPLAVVKDRRQLKKHVRSN